MGRPRKSDSLDEATRERLISAAARAFAGVGYEAARLADIAAEAGIRRSSLLYHFASKQALYAAVIASAFQKLERSMERATSSEATFEARLERVVEALIQFEREHLPLLGVLMRGLLDQDQQGVMTLERSFIPLVDRIEAFVRGSSDTRLPVRFPVRAAILQLIVAHLVRSAMGASGETLWKGDAHTWTLARAILHGAPHTE